MLSRSAGPGGAGRRQLLGDDAIPPVLEGAEASPPKRPKQLLNHGLQAGPLRFIVALQRRALCYVCIDPCPLSNHTIPITFWLVR